ncbi:hypothetical protein PIB30_016136 [Stylosanthes scabra]|uniref:Uncharacterized protein n=1 Tax=Stylosanthes scabra TaxID=79078 RepID=A0ABU6S7E6_9FABA|nr:hypothetical protein [Stylosanthes scabra]
MSFPFSSLLLHPPSSSFSFSPSFTVVTSTWQWTSFLPCPQRNVFSCTPTLFRSGLPRQGGNTRTKDSVILIVIRTKPSIDPIFWNYNSHNDLPCRSSDSGDNKSGSKIREEEGVNKRGRSKRLRSSQSHTDEGDEQEKSKMTMSYIKMPELP